MTEHKTVHAMASTASVSPKFFRKEGHNIGLRGLTYGPFPENNGQNGFPSQEVVRADLDVIRSLHANAIRVYTIPTLGFLDLAADRDILVLVDIPWQRHRCFLEDEATPKEARDMVRRAANELGGHPALLGLSVGNEIPADIVRYYGHRRVESFLSELVAVAKSECPELLTTYCNFPTTEYLHLPFLDFLSFNVFLEDVSRFRQYLQRLILTAGDRPLVISEFGIDAYRHGEEQQADIVSQGVAVARDLGLAGTFVFSYSDDWHTGGAAVEEWSFGATTRERLLKPLSHSLANIWNGCRPRSAEPLVSVVVCSYNAEATLARCLESLRGLRYANYEVIVIDDGSTDSSARIAESSSGVICVRIEHCGLSAARNVGIDRATGDVIAFVDADCVVDEDWLTFLTRPIVEGTCDCVGGPNIGPDEVHWVARAIAMAPGSPQCVMLDDVAAEHVPGCNCAFTRASLTAVNGFDSRFHTAGDDVDLCWRLLDLGYRIAFASGAFVWHHRRRTVRAYFGQQKGYAQAESILMMLHPERFSDSGSARWSGVIYQDCRKRSDGSVYYGITGDAPFQRIYSGGAAGAFHLVTSFRWYFVSWAFVLTGILEWKFWLPAACMLGASLVATFLESRKSHIFRREEWRVRMLVYILHLVHQAYRDLHRALAVLLYFSHRRFRRDGRLQDRQRQLCAEIGNRCRADVVVRLAALLTEAFPGVNTKCLWNPWDLEVHTTPITRVRVYVVSESLSSTSRFVRIRHEVIFTSLFVRSLVGLACIPVALLVAGRTESAAWSLTAVCVTLAFGWAARAKSSRHVALVCNAAVSEFCPT